jgi:pyridoxamine 5'-phosphate oxidase
MTKEEVIDGINENPVFYLATVDEGKPRVRGMLLYRADENGLVFHTARCKDLSWQLAKDNNVEMCFNVKGTQIRISGKAELIDDNSIKDEIAANPSRAFIKKWKDSVSPEIFYKEFLVYHVKGEDITLWTMARNLEPKIEMEY